MSTINPPVELEDSGNQYRLEYIQNIATQADFDYPQVTTSTAEFVYVVRFLYQLTEESLCPPAGSYKRRLSLVLLLQGLHMLR